MQAKSTASPIRVVQVVLSLCIGGTEKIVFDLSRKMHGDRFHTHVLCLDEIGEFGEILRTKEGISVESLGRRPGLDRALVDRLANRIVGISADIVHAHHYSPFFYGILATLLARGKTLGSLPRFVFTEHGIEYPFRRSWKRCLANPILLRMADEVTTISRYTSENLVFYENYPRQKLRVLYNGIDLEAFSNGATREAARANLGLPRDANVVAVVARLDPVKNHAMLFRSFKEIEISVPNAVLLVVGDGPERDRLRALGDRLSPDGKIRFLGSRSDVPDMIRAADIFALPSFSEGMSVTLLEAMAAGLPVVATRVGGNDEVVMHGETGFLVPNDHASEMARRLLQLFGDENLRRRMGQAGRKRAVDFFSTERMVSAFSSLYQDVIARKTKANRDGKMLFII
jgi:glycosyltransferase involved in cell wall biosynthesis